MRLANTQHENTMPNASSQIADPQSAVKRARNFKNIAGIRYGRLTAVKPASPAISKAGSVNYRWVCMCDCGAVKAIHSSALASGNSKSCGCLQAEKRLARMTTHGLSKTPEYFIWNTMRGRCENPSNKQWNEYGGRGIAVCKRWEKFVNFHEDMGKRPSSKHSIDRIDNNGNYEPGNCRWASKKQQARNTRSQRSVSAFGISRCLAEWEESTGIKSDTIAARIDRLGWSAEKALTKPLQYRPKNKKIS